MLNISEKVLMAFLMICEKCRKMRLVNVLYTSGLKQVMGLKRAWSWDLPAAGIRGVRSVDVYKTSARIFCSPSARRARATDLHQPFNRQTPIRASSVLGINKHVFKINWTLLCKGTYNPTCEWCIQLLVNFIRGIHIFPPQHNVEGLLFSWP